MLYRINVEYEIEFTEEPADILSAVEDVLQIVDVVDMPRVVGSSVWEAMITRKSTDIEEV
jgi:hypothetical protein